MATSVVYKVRKKKTENTNTFCGNKFDATKYIKNKQRNKQPLSKKDKSSPIITNS